ncbi:MAG: protoporphyrinogen oxidase [Myxococcota bacterium]|jgi:menaquinone-dependent protoporphyrinogen oxidase|nr:protoporphyrinogen oxidase [Myxococcota bacterium]
MNPRRIDIYYETIEGQTAAVAQRMKARLEQAGHEVRVARCRDTKTGDIEQADIAIVGGSIHAGNHHTRVLEFARQHAALLSSKPSAFFLVCLTAHSGKPEAPGIVAGYLETFAQKTDWKPRVSKAFAGALLYTQYGFVKRKIMETINRKEGGETDVTKDHVYTDWQAVDAFADEVSTL